MSEEFFLAAGMGLLLALRKPSAALRFGFMEGLQRIFYEALEFFFQSVLALFLWAGILKLRNLPLDPAEFSLFLSSALIYALTRARRTEFLRLPIACFCFFMLRQTPQEASWLDILRCTAGFSLLIFLVRMAVAALRQRLLFSEVPQVFEGLPVLLISLAVFLLALSGIWQALGFF